MWSVSVSIVLINVQNGPIHPSTYPLRSEGICVKIKRIMLRRFALISLEIAQTSTRK